MANFWRFFGSCIYGKGYFAECGNFPSTTCSCPAQTNCYHVVAARMAVGLNETTKKKTVNLTQLRKNVRKRPDKTSGRKRPRVNDTDVVAAGDGDDATTSAVAVAVAGLTQPVADDDDVAPSDVAVTTADDDRCSACGMIGLLSNSVSRNSSTER